ncbi:hypothetical protein [Clostridium estertheticum]|uniref:hypothetical protein n=1 Tax=Clostridium estertheticum TaxID=238834 RepID=UPI001C0DA4EA|nr:hypothetical protein [Clostridium estertheticum]MBU3183228.1 hypothetical protein [Clostridium estertheticum]
MSRFGIFGSFYFLFLIAVAGLGIYIMILLIKALKKIHNTIYFIKCELRKEISLSLKYVKFSTLLLKIS